MTKFLSVFFPCFNEEGSVENTVQKANLVLQKLGLVYEIIVIDDGSTDSTGKIADNLAKGDKRIKVIHHQKNLGYGEALKSGFYSAKYNTIVYTDGDGQFDFSEVEKFLKEIEDHDLVIGYRIKRQDPFFRILFKKGWKASLFLFFGLTLKDVDCGFKIVRKKVLEKIPHLQSTRGAMINAELAIKAKKYGFKVKEMGVNHYPRISGKPTGASIPVIVKSYIDLLRLWWKLKDQKFLFILLLAILFLATFLRFYKIDQYMTFLGDEGRDAIIVKDILTFKNFPLIGPPTSVGNIYLGPLYYYMMASAMSLFWLSPVAAAGMNALIGVATVFLIYYLGKVWFSKIAGLIAAYLYAISPVTIIYSKSSWNPNPTPFFSLLSIVGVYKSHSSGDYRWLILTGASLAAAIQMHYLALILLPIVGTFWIKELLAKTGRFFWTGTISGILSFFILMSPLLIFDLKHNFLNYRAITTLLFSKDTSIGFNVFNTLERIPTIYSQSLISRYLTGENPILTLIISLTLLIPLIYTGYLLHKNRQFNYGFWILNNWLLIGILGLTFYKQEIYDHYLGFMNPVPFLLLGALSTIDVLSKQRWLMKGAIIILLAALTVVNLQKSPLLSQPNNQLKRTQDVARFIIKESGNKQFNFALLAERNYDAAYQFYLDQYGHKPKQVPFDITEQLFVVCEDPICNPVGHPKQEISHFGWVRIERTWEVYGVKVYKLVHNPTGKP